MTKMDGLSKAFQEIKDFSGSDDRLIYFGTWETIGSKIADKKLINKNHGKQKNDCRG